MSLNKYIFFFVVLISPWNSYASNSNKVFIFGGGPTPNESQVSIELNTQWIRNIIQRQNPNRQILIHYTDGNDDGLDVRSWSPVENEHSRFQPLARVFGSEIKNGYTYTSSNIAENVKPSDAKSVSNALSELFLKSRPGDDLLLIYQGHGGYRSNTNKNHFRLWNGSHITVSELEVLMSKADSEATIRFMFPQCFSGAFTRVIYNGAEVKNGIAKGRRCGFVAQREDRESEGCTDSVNTGNYRDYSSYFFSAIDGKGINGSALLENPDRDKDGVITLLEAHYYSLKNAYSVDFSRSTSQDFLEEWQPWYLRWMPTPHNPDNVYSEIAEYLANRFKLMGKGNNIISEISSRLRSLAGLIEELKKEQAETENKISKIQKNIKKELSRRWPAILYPYTRQFSNIMNEDLSKIEASILAHSSYQELVNGQERSASITKELLDANRELVQMKKILWMRKLARILDQFQRYADDKDKQVYERLVQCEDSPL